MSGEWLTSRLEPLDQIGTDSRLPATDRSRGVAAPDCWARTRPGLRSARDHIHAFPQYSLWADCPRSVYDLKIRSGTQANRATEQGP